MSPHSASYFRFFPVPMKQVGMSHRKPIWLCLALLLALACAVPGMADDITVKAKPERPVTGLDLSPFLSQTKAPPASSAAGEFRQGAALLEAQKYGEAEASFRKTLATDPRFAPAYLGLAEIRMEKRDPAGAGAYLQKAVTLAPRDSVILTDWGHYLFFRKRYDEAKLAFTKASALDPKAARPHYELGDLYLLGLHRPADAAAAYREALAIDPNNSRVHYTLANALAEAGRLDDAQSQLEEAVRLDAKDPVLVKALGDFCLRRGKLDQAQQAYERALVIDPRYLPARIASGDVLVARKNLDGAIAEYKAALQIAPRATDPLVKIAILREKQGRWQEAAQFYRKALDADPKLGLASNNLAWLLLQHGQNPAEVLKLANETVEHYPRNANFEDTLAWVLRAHKESARALIAAKKAAALAPKDPQIMYHLGVLYQETGQAALAARSYRQALAITRAFDGANDAQVRLTAMKKVK